MFKYRDDQEDGTYLCYHFLNLLVEESHDNIVSKRDLIDTMGSSVVKECFMPSFNLCRQKGHSTAIRYYVKDNPDYDFIVIHDNMLSARHNAPKYDNTRYISKDYFIRIHREIKYKKPSIIILDSVVMTDELMRALYTTVSKCNTYAMVNVAPI